MLSVFLLIILATVLVLNFQSANKSVKERLYENAKNSATSLSLSLGGAKGDKTMMSTMISANFDSGHYKEISLVDVQNRAIFSKVGEKSIKGVPQWFIDAVDMKAPVAMANVSAGWSQVGILKVQSDAGCKKSSGGTPRPNLNTGMNSGNGCRGFVDRGDFNIHDIWYCFWFNVLVD